MAVAETSKKAFDSIKDKLTGKRKIVLDAIGELGMASNETIADYLNWPINRVTGRVTELNKMGYVGIEGLTRNKSGFTAKLWSVRDPNDQKLKNLVEG